MKIEIEIPVEFEEHFNQDKFEDTLRRLSADAHLLAGRYEQEIAIMLIKAFADSKTAYDVEKLIGRLEEYLQSEKNLKEIVDTGKEIKNPVVSRTIGKIEAYESTIEIANQLAEEYNNDFCKWEYNDYEEKWQTDCGVLFTLNDSDKEITNYCPCCGKEIKIINQTGEN